MQDGQLCNKKLHKQRGFTLAEVLLTLAVVGVLAAMIIPQLQQSIQNQGYVTALKKSYRVLSDNTKQLAADNGGTLVGVLSWSNPATFTKYMNVAKTCMNNVVPNGCWAVPYNLKGGLGWNPTESFNPGSILNDRTLLLFRTTSSTNADQTFKCDATNLITSDECGIVFVDVNGLKPPNTWGRDMFTFFIRKDGIIVPSGTPAVSGHTDACRTSVDQGLGCAGKIIKDGWQMNY